MKKIHKGQTGNNVIVKVLDPQTQGRGMIGITANKVRAAYYREGANGPVIFNVIDGILGSFAPGAWTEIDSTNMPGQYTLSVPDGAVASGARRVAFCLSFHNGIIGPDVDFEIELDAIDYQNGDTAGLSGIDVAERSIIGNS